MGGYQVQVLGEQFENQAATLADGQYTFTNMPPGSYRVAVVGFDADTAQSIPVLAGQITTLDWIESARVQVAPSKVEPTATAVPTATPTVPPKPAVQGPVGTPTPRPPPPDAVIGRMLGSVVDQFVNAFLTGMAVVAVAAVLMIAIIRRRR